MVIPHKEQNPTKRFIPVTQWPQFHAWPPLGGLRHLIFHAKENGFDQCIIRAGRRVLIDEAAFMGWLGSKRGTNEAR